MAPENRVALRFDLIKFVVEKKPELTLSATLSLVERLADFIMKGEDEPVPLPPLPPP